MFPRAQFPVFPNFSHCKFVVLSRQGFTSHLHVSHLSICAKLSQAGLKSTRVGPPADVEQPNLARVQY